MSTSSGSRDDDRFDELAKEFAERYHRGERPALQEFIDRLPEMADKIRETFPTLVEVEQTQPEARAEAALAVQDRVGPVPISDTTSAFEPTLAELLPATQASASETRPGSHAPATVGGLVTVEATGVHRQSGAIDGPTSALTTAVSGRDDTIDGSSTIAHDTRRGDFIPDRVIAGRYTLRDVLGEGGMGTVYRADQTEPVKRQVALKLIKIGMDSRAVLARFNAERQALALMDHPNIARVFDGGTTQSNQPFFVMELVQGVPITSYCDQRRLTVRARLELFVAVCQAVQHAHQKGIIHRDLKPSNVLVTEVDGRPTPKVIDFGVAKATEFDLTDMSLGDTGAIVGTPTYMSPEQADPSSMDIDTRTDVYALGVILYELLAGSPPIDAKQFKRGAILEMLRMVREVEPPRPSTKLSTSDTLPSIAASRDIEPQQLKRALQGDLDWIVMKALEKDRTRRYETATGFAADVMRHLAHEPVVAAPPSRAYRMRKFVRKHRGAVIAASMVLLSLLAGIAGTTYGMIRAESRRREAEAARVAEARAREGEKQQYDRYKTTINFAVNDLRHTLNSSIYAKTVQDEFGRQVMQFVDKISHADSDGINQRAKLTLMLHEADSLRSRPDADVETVYERYVQAIARAEEIDRNETRDFDLAAMNLSAAHAKLADFAMSTRQYDRAFEGFSKSLAIAERVLRSPRTKEYTETARKGFVARSLNSLGWVTYQLGKPAEALELLKRSLALYAEVMASRRDEENLSNVAEIHVRMATVHQHNKAERRALEHIEEAAAARRELLSLEPKNQSYKLNLSKTLDSLGDAQFFLGQPDLAKKSYDESLALARELSEPEELLTVRRRLSLMLYKSATAALKLGNRSEAQKRYDECLAIREQSSHAKPRDLEIAIEWMLALARCGKTVEARTKAENLLKFAAAQNSRGISAALFRLQSAFALAIAADNLDRDHPVEMWSPERLAERKKLIDRSFEILDLAIASGFDDHYQLETDPDIDALRGDPRFVAILEKLRTQSKVK
jgi:serine/threonine protein kinase/tetratricopeptide (TPR) repeat protein